MSQNLITMIYGESDRDRCDAWLIFALQAQTDMILVLAAGHVPFSKKCLRDEMLDYLSTKLLKNDYLRIGFSVFERNHPFSNNHPRVDVRFTPGNAWGTFEETLRAVEQMRLRSLKEITVFSSPEHMPRILNIWKMLAPEIKVTASFSKKGMDKNLVRKEKTKDFQSKLFFFIYKYFGTRALFTVSWIKNLLLNVIFAPKK